MKRYSYDEAIDYIEGKGVHCDPCRYDEAELVCDLLDYYEDGYDKWEEPYYYKSTLDSIIKQAQDYLEEMKEE